MREYIGMLADEQLATWAIDSKFAPSHLVHKLAVELLAARKAIAALRHVTVGDHSISADDINAAIVALVDYDKMVAS